jgi:NAD(P)-dependent dehydrogenase (short-subunit alcohol dehydrogenase family)
MGGAVEHLALGLAVDLAPVRVNAVCPGLILTEHTNQMPAAMIQAFTASLPLPRGGSPAECAQAYLYLMRAGYTTGQVLRVDGGGTAV